MGKLIYFTDVQVNFGIHFCVSNSEGLYILKL